MAKKTTSKTTPVKELFCEEKRPAKKDNFGIIIAALDSPYYGNYALQLAMSLKHTSPKVQIALLCNDAGKGHLTEDKLTVFDKIIKINKTAVTSNKRAATLKFKTYLYQISPFDTTLYLDADTIFLPKRSVYDMLNELPKGLDFTMQNRGFLDLEKATDLELNSRFNIWASSKQIKDNHKFKKGHLYNLSSELIYFKKTKEVEKLFKDAQAYFDKPGVDFENFNGSVPDELPFCLSMIKNDLYPHAPNYRPFYWEAFDKKRLLLKPNLLYQQYFGVSFGGNFQEPFIKKFYDNLARYYANAWGLQYVFPLKDKRGFLPNRHTI